MNIATKGGDELVTFRSCENLEDCHLALGNLLKASEYRKKSLSKRVGALTEEATEGSACNLQGNFYRHFSEAMNTPAVILFQNFAINYNAKMCMFELRNFFDRLC